MIIWYILLGAIVLAGGLLAAVFLLPKWVAESFEHRADCDCNPCTLKRMRRWDKQQARKREEETTQGLFSRQNIQTGMWVSTNELRKDMLVASSSGKLYTIKELRFGPEGCLITLAGKGVQRSMVFVEAARLDNKIWKPTYRRIVGL
jgi:hypothetical protein